MMHWKLTSNQQLPLNQLMKAINEWDFNVPLVIKLEKYSEKRSLSQNALCHLWYRIITQWLEARNIYYAEYYDYEDEDADPNYVPETYPYDEDTVKEMLKKEILGVRRIVCSDGSISEFIKSTSKLSKGEMHHFMNRIYEKFYNVGLILPVPEDSVYQKLEDKQNA